MNMNRRLHVAPDRQEMWVDIEVRCRKYAIDLAEAWPSPYEETPWQQAERQLRKAGCDVEARFIHMRPDYEGNGTCRLTFASSRPKGQAMNSQGRAVDDARPPSGLAPSDKHTPSPDGTHRGQSVSSTHPGPAASGNGAGDPTPGT